MRSLLLNIFLLFNIFNLSSSHFISNLQIKKYDTKLLLNKEKSVLSSVSMISENNICPEYLEKFTNLLDQEKSEQLVKGVTGFLTKVDGFGAYVLHTNDVIINCILNNDLLPLEQKKSIILFFIKLSQHGDATGSHILQFYHDLVSCLL